MSEVFQFIGVLLAALLIVVGSMVTIGTLVGNYDCGRYGENTGRIVKADFGTCYVQQKDGTFAPREELELRAVTNES